MFGRCVDLRQQLQHIQALSVRPLQPQRIPADAGDEIRTRGQNSNALGSGSTSPVSATAGILATNPARSCSVMACTSEAAKSSSSAICRLERFRPMK